MKDVASSNSRHYLVFRPDLFENVQVPEVFREKLGRIYETPPEEAGEEYTPVERIPTVREFVEHHRIPHRTIANRVVFGIPMLDHREMREAEAAQGQLVQAGLMEAEDVWIHSPWGIRELIEQWEAQEQQDNEEETP